MPHEGELARNNNNRTIQRGASATIRDSTATILGINDHFQSDDSRLTSITTPPVLSGNTASPRVAYLMCRGSIGGSCDGGVERKRSVAETGVVQNRIRSRLTLPHLAKFQTNSLDVHTSNYGPPELLHVNSDGMPQLDQPQCKSLDISPENHTVKFKKKRQETLMPQQVPPISIHVRQPSQKSSVQG